MILLTPSKALPTKPLNFVALSDADSRTALSFVQQKLKDADADVTFTSETSAYIERLGGRASDLESVSTICVYFFSLWLTNVAADIQSTKWS